MILVECQQGSPEWLAARCGVITASRFRDALTRKKDGTPDAKSCAYAAQIAIERVSGQSTDENFVSWQMRRGVELEPAARLAFETRTGLLVQESGVALTDDGVYGYSTDGFIGEDGCIEIKCVVSAEKVIALWRDKDLSEYVHQIQGGLWLTGRRWCKFVLYTPQLAPVGKELMIKHVERDENFIEKMEVDLLAFAKRVDENEDVLRTPELASEWAEAA